VKHKQAFIDSLIQLGYEKPSLRDSLSPIIKTLGVENAKDSLDKVARNLNDVFSGNSIFGLNPLLGSTLTNTLKTKGLSPWRAYAQMKGQKGEIVIICKVDGFKDTDDQGMDELKAYLEQRVNRILYKDVEVDTFYAPYNDTVYVSLIQDFFI